MPAQHVMQPLLLPNSISLNIAQDTNQTGFLPSYHAIKLTPWYSCSNIQSFLANAGIHCKLEGDNTQELDREEWTAHHPCITFSRSRRFNQSIVR